MRLEGKKMNSNGKLVKEKVSKEVSTDKQYTTEEKLELIMKAMWNLEGRVTDLEKEVAKNSIKNKILS